RPIFEFIDLEEHRKFERLAAEASASSFHEQTWQRADGRRFDAEIALSAVRHGNENAVQIAVRDITHQKRKQALQLAQSRILGMVATGASLSDVLHAIAHLIEQYSDRGFCSILLLSED